MLRYSENEEKIQTTDSKGLKIERTQKRLLIKSLCIDIILYVRIYYNK